MTLSDSVLYPALPDKVYTMCRYIQLSSGSSRLKAGCGQDCPPHGSILRGAVALVRL
jgi:hypothetical protein